MQEREDRLNPKVVGLIMGLIVGLVLVFAGGWNALVVGIFLLAGWLVGKFVAGEIDLDELYDRHVRGRTRRPER
jgi:uncharacterized membrane protein